MFIKEMCLWRETVSELMQQSMFVKKTLCALKKEREREHVSDLMKA